MLERLGINAKEAEKTLMVASSEKKNQALKMAESLQLKQELRKYRRLQKVLLKIQIRLLKLTRLIWKMVKKTEWQSPCLTVLN